MSLELCVHHLALHGDFSRKAWTDALQTPPNALAQQLAGDTLKLG